MAIFIVTGGVGSGKTNFVLTDYLINESYFANRQICINGVTFSPDYVLPDTWTLIDDDKAKDVENYPTDAVIVIDEAQRIFPPTSINQTPAYIMAFSTSRHRGNDIILVSQAPTLINHWIRKLAPTYIKCVNIPPSQTLVSFRDDTGNTLKTKLRRINKSGSYVSAVTNRIRPSYMAKYVLLLVVVLACIVYAVVNGLGLGQDLGLVDSDNNSVFETIANKHSPGPTAISLNGSASVLDDSPPFIPSPNNPTPYLHQSYNHYWKQPQEPPLPICMSTPSECICHDQQARRMSIDYDTCRKLSTTPLWRVIPYHQQVERTDTFNPSS